MYVLSGSCTCLCGVPQIPLILKESHMYHMHTSPTGVLSLSPAAVESDYLFNLSDREGLTDLYDISRALASPS